jgi:hypothetical protein
MKAKKTRKKGKSEKNLTVLMCLLDAILGGWVCPVA